MFNNFVFLQHELPKQLHPVKIRINLIQGPQSQIGTPSVSSQSHYPPKWNRINRIVKLTQQIPEIWLSEEDVRQEVDQWENAADTDEGVQSNKAEDCDLNGRSGRRGF